MRREWVVVLGLFAVAAAADLARGTPYLFPGFWAVFGFAGCWVIVVASKRLGKHWLQRPEGYDEREPRA